MRRKFSASMRRITLLSMIAAMVTVLTFPTSASALITDFRGNYGDCGTQMMRAYFANACGDPYIDANGDSGFVMPRRSISGVLRPALYGIGSKTELYNYLVGSTGLGSGSQQSRVGAAFIIHTMLGRDGNQANAAGGKTISAADRAALQEALQNPDIQFTTGPYSNRYNSGSRVVGGAIDESFFDNSLGGGTVSNVNSIILRKVSTNTVVYVLEIECANPIGVPRPGLDEPWTSTAMMEIRRIDPITQTAIAPGVPGDTSVTGQVGQRYGWFWSVRNDGPNPTNISIVRERLWDFPAPYGDSGGVNGGTWVSAGPNRAAGVGSGGMIFPYGSVGSTPQAIQASDAGKTFCLRTRYDPSQLDGTMRTLPFYCLTIAYDYTLTPFVSMSSSTTAIGSTPPTVQYSVDNDGPSYSQGITLTVKQFVAAPSQTVANALRDAVGSNCGIPTNVSACATDVYTSPGGQIFGLGMTQVQTGAYNAATHTYPIPPMTTADTNYPAGTKVCRVLALSRASETITNRWSAPACVTIGQKPYMAIYNGDAWSGGSFAAIDPSCSIAGSQAGGFEGSYTSFAGPNYYGSFGEYALFSIGPVVDFGSAGRPRDGTFQAVKQTYKATGVFGNYYTKSIAAASSPTQHCLDDLLTVYGGQPSSAVGASVAPASLASGVYHTTGDITLTASTFATSPTKRIVIIADGNVNVDGNLLFADGPYSGPEAISSLVVIAKGSILVSQNVTRMDGIFQAYRNFTTCRESTAGGLGLGSGNCTQQLVVNGSASANKFVLRRIAGGGPTTQTVPGEIFNMRSDILLSEYGRSRANAQLIRTTSIQELPPRY